MAASQCVDCGKRHPERVLVASPFQSLIAHQMLPTPSETVAIHDFLRATDAEIERRESDIARLLCEVEELRRSSHRHKAIIHPIRRLPSEILGEIFQQLNDVEAEKPYRYGLLPELRLLQPYMTSPRPHRAPLIFGEVCRQWRAIALSLPSLWNSISLDCTSANIRRNITLCDVWLKRSGALPLSIRFHRQPRGLNDRVSSKEAQDHRDLIGTILPYSHRWRFVDLEQLPALSYDALDQLPPESLPRLECLSVSYRYGDQSTSSMLSQTKPWAAFSIAPRLTYLLFDNVGGANVMTRRGEPLGFPWSQLTHICLEDCSLNDCHHILSQASTAIACTFDVTRSSSLEPTPVSHLHLQNLKLTSAVELRELWDCLTCSSLSTLYVEDPQTHVHGLLEFLSRSGKTIEDFTLDSSALDDTQSLACLRNMPILRRLTVEEFGTGTQFTDRVCEALTLASEGTMSPLVPNLEYLHLIGASFSHRAMARMLESRVRFSPHSSFKTVHLVTLRNMSDSAYGKLMTLGNLGLDIKVNIECYEGGPEGSEASDVDEADEDESD